MRIDKKTVAVFLAVIMMITFIPTAVAAAVKQEVTTILAPSLVFEDVYSGASWYYTEEKTLVLPWKEGTSALLYDSKTGEIFGDGYVPEYGYYIPPFSEGFVEVQKDGKFGFANETGELIIPCEYDDVDNFFDGVAVVSKNGKYGFINTHGQLVIPLEYDEAAYFSEELALVAKGGKYGFINKAGQTVIPLEYDAASYIYDGLAVVEKDGKTGVINKAGQIVIPLEYDVLYNFDDGLALVRLGDYETGKWGFIDISNQIVVPIEYDYLGYFFDGLATAQKDGKHGFIDKAGQVVIPFEYDYANDFSEGFASILSGDWETGKWGFINKTGQMVIPAEYDHAGYFYDGLAMVEKDGKWGFINTSGQLVIPMEYDYADTFSYNELAKVGKDGKLGFINKAGEIAIPLEYDYMYDFIGDLLVVYKGGKSGIINAEGEIIVPLDYQDILYVGSENNNNYYWVKQNDLWGIIAVGDPMFGISTLTDPDTGITVTGNFDSTATLQVTPVTSGADFTLAETALKDAEKFILYNIALLKDGAEIQPDGKVTVSMPVPEGYDGARCKFYRINEDGSVADMNAKLADGKLVFETDHFSLYAIAQMKDASSNGGAVGTGPVTNNPKTGDTFWPASVCVLVLLLVSVAAMTFIAGKKKSKISR